MHHVTVKYKTKKKVVKNHYSIGYELSTLIDDNSFSCTKNTNYHQNIFKSLIRYRICYNIQEKWRQEKRWDTEDNQNM